MAIECNLWPMKFLTKAVGSKDRKLICHPKDSILRSGIRRDKNGNLAIVDASAIKIKTGIYYPEIKEQGHRHIYCRDARGKYQVFGRRLNVNNTYTDIMPKLKGMHLPEIPINSAIDFEMVWPGHPDSEITTAIKECPDKLEMVAFSTPIWENNVYIFSGMSWKEGRLLLKKSLSDQHIQMSRAFKPITLTEENKTTVLTSLLNTAESKKIEGFVLKGKTCEDWWKLKGINEADVFVIGFKVSDSETRKGMVTAIKIAVYGDDNGWKRMGNVSGFNMEQMENMTIAYNKYKESKANHFMFRVARVIYQEIAGKGLLRHGFFDSWRDDKNSVSCTMEQFK